MSIRSLWFLFIFSFSIKLSVIVMLPYFGLFGFFSSILLSFSLDLPLSQSLYSSLSLSICISHYVSSTCSPNLYIFLSIRLSLYLFFSASSLTPHVLPFNIPMPSFMWHPYSIIQEARSLKDGGRGWREKVPASNEYSDETAWRENVPASNEYSDDTALLFQVFSLSSATFLCVPSTFRSFPLWFLSSSISDFSLIDFFLIWSQPSSLLFSRDELLALEMWKKYWSTPSKHSFSIKVNGFFSPRGREENSILHLLFLPCIIHSFPLEYQKGSSFTERLTFFQKRVMFQGK